MPSQTAIVTGASRGIGRAIAIRLAAGGMRVVLCARDETALRDSVAAIDSAGGTALAVSLDLRQPDAPARLVRTTLDAYGDVDIIVNNAGATRRGDFESLTDDDWTDGFALKLFGAVRLTRAAWPCLKRRGGSVVNIAGIGGRTPGPQFAVGGSVNAALLSFTKSIADVGIRDGIQVNAINPGAIRTERLARRLEAVAALKGTDIDGAAVAFVREANMTRLGEPEDVANLVAYIVSPAGRFLQGAIIDLDGGQTKTI
jgi:3-oxoacyl-[acyl-carrier protein] reductase